MAQAKSGDTVEVQFTGKLDDGTVFENSSPDNPLKLKIGDQHTMPAFEHAVALTGQNTELAIGIKEHAVNFRSGAIMQGQIAYTRNSAGADL